MRRSRGCGQHTSRADDSPYKYLIGPARRFECKNELVNNTEYVNMRV